MNAAGSAAGGADRSVVIEGGHVCSARHDGDAAGVRGGTGGAFEGVAGRGASRAPQFDRKFGKYAKRILTACRN